MPDRAGHQTLHDPHHTAGTARRPDPGQPSVDAAYCPECGMPAWVEWGDTVGSTSGAVELVKVRCFARHWFLMPADRLLH